MSIELTDQQARDVATIIDAAIANGTYVGIHTTLGAIAEATRPAPKYREGEVRWLTENAGRWAAFRVDGGWAMRPDGERVWFDASEITLSEPVVVVPAPTDEERGSIEVVRAWLDGGYVDDPDLYDAVVDMLRITDCIDNQEARDE